MKKFFNHSPRVTETLANSDLLNPITAFVNGASVDAVFQRTPPSAIILDYMYGVAAYKIWGSKPGCNVIEKYYNEHYAQIPVPPHRPSFYNQSNYSFNEGDNPPSPTPILPKNPYRARMRKTMGKIIDKVNWI